MICPHAQWYIFYQNPTGNNLPVGNMHQQHYQNKNKKVK